MYWCCMLVLCVFILFLPHSLCIMLIQPCSQVWVPCRNQSVYLCPNLCMHLAWQLLYWNRIRWVFHGNVHIENGPFSNGNSRSPKKHDVLYVTMKTWKPMINWLPDWFEPIISSGAVLPVKFSDTWGFLWKRKAFIVILKSRGNEDSSVEWTY